jgi:hypothetical protein
LSIRIVIRGGRAVPARNFQGSRRQAGRERLGNRRYAAALDAPSTLPLAKPRKMLPMCPRENRFGSLFRAKLSRSRPRQINLPHRGLRPQDRCAGGPQCRREPRRE